VHEKKKAKKMGALSHGKRIEWEWVKKKKLEQKKKKKTNHKQREEGTEPGERGEKPKIKGYARKGLGT